MKASRRSLPIVLSCLFAAATTSAIAGGSQSALDPYAHIQAPEGKKASKSALPASEDPNAVQSTATYVTMPFNDNQEAGGAKKGLPGSGLLSGLTKPMKGFKNASSGLASGTKNAGGKMSEGMANSGKKMKEGLASTGGVFAKGAKAIGDGFKATGSKMKEGTQAMGSKIAGLPGALKRDGGKAPEAPKSTPVVAEKPKVQNAGGSKLAFLNKIPKIKLKKGSTQPAAVAKAPVAKEENLSEKPQVADVNAGTNIPNDLTSTPTPSVAETPVVEQKHETHPVAKAHPVEKSGGNKVTQLASSTTKKLAAAPAAMKNRISKLLGRKGSVPDPAPQATAEKPKQSPLDPQM